MSFRCRLLYIYGSNNTGAYSELAAAVLGDGSQTVKGLPAFRVLARLDRLLPTNVGLLDARDHFNRFSMHVGSDVVDARRGRPAGQDPDPHRHLRLRRRRTRHYQCGPLRPFLVNAQAPNLKAWTEWCDEQGGKLLDGSVDLKQILDGFIIPIGLRARPPHVLLGLEWPWQIVGVSVTYDGYTYQLLDIDFEVDDYSTGGPFLFSLVTPAWRLAYRATFEPDGLTYTPLADDAEVASRPSPCRCALGSTRTSRRSSSTVTE